MTAQIHFEMHQDHRLWDSEIKGWRGDLHSWQLESKAAREQLKELEAALQKHENTLREHASAIRLDEERIDAHEHALGRFEEGDTSAELLEFVPKHQSEANRQLEQRTRHEELKRHHHEFIARWRLLVKSLTPLA